MLFMVIERFNRGIKPVGERYTRQGRMLPGGVAYVASWMDPKGAFCFQLMEANDRAALDAWIGRWSDLVDFEVSPVLTSAEYWAMVGAAT